MNTESGNLPVALKVRSVLAAQREAFLREGFPSSEIREDRLDRLLLALLESVPDLCIALDADFGRRPAGLSLQIDVLPVVRAVEHMRAHLSEWMEPITTEDPLTRLTSTIDVAPLGVVGVMGSWTFPVALVLRPAAEALAAGNRVMIKCSGEAPRAGRVLAEALGSVFPAEELVVVNGAADISKVFAELDFDHLMFSGSPKVGRLVLRAAERTRTPATLALGGKNPIVVGRGADLSDTARRVARSRLLNGGQSGLAPDCVFVPRSELDRFVIELRSAFVGLTLDYPTSREFVPIINDHNYSRLLALVEDAVEKGAVALSGVLDIDDAVLPDPRQRLVTPMILLAVTDEMTIAHEEILGPLLVVYPYDKIQDAISHITRRPKSLVAYWYGDEDADFTVFRDGTRTGEMVVNDFALHSSTPAVAFGGVADSGFALNGRAGFDTFSHRRTVITPNVPRSAGQGLTPDGCQAAQAASEADLALALDRVRRRLSGFRRYR